MKKILALAALLLGVSLPAFAQLGGSWQSTTTAWVRIDGGNVVSGGGVTGGSCTNQFVSAIDTSGVPTCASVTNATITNSTIDLTAKVTGRLPLANFAAAASNRILLGSGVSGSGASYSEIAAGLGATVYTGPGGTSRFGFDPHTQLFLYDDFLGVPATTTNPGGALAWTVSNQNTPGNLTKGASDANHQGVVAMTGNVGNNAVQFIRTDVTAFSPTAGMVIGCLVNVVATGDGIISCGLNDSTTTPETNTDTLTLYYNSATSTNWLIRSRAAAGGGSTTSSTAVTTGWHWLEIYVQSVDGSSGGSVHFYVDGTELDVSPLTTNIPQGSNTTGFACGFKQTAGGAIELMDIDKVYVGIYSGLTTP